MAFPPEITAFWQAFAPLENELAALPSRERVERGNELLAKHVSGLALELSAGTDATPAELTFSAHGDVERFPLLLQLVAAAPRLKHHRVRAFRERSAHPDFSIRMGDFELATSDLLIACGPDEGRIALELRFDREVPHDLQDHAREMAFVLLDHVLGEYDFAVKVGAVDFVEEVADLEAPWTPLHGFAQVFDDFWRDVLGRTGDFPDGEHEWTGLTLQFKAEKGGDTAIVTLNRSANAVAMRADLVHALVLELPVADRDALSAAHALQDQAATVLEQGRMGILAHVLMRGGRRQAVYYVGDEGRARAALAPLLSREGVDADAVSVHFDPAWSRYFDYAVHAG